MKILVYGINYTPELTGIGKYTGEMSEWLAEQGHEVTVVTAPPYYPAWRVDEGYSAAQYRHEVINGVTVWRCPLWVPKVQSGLRRMVHLASFAFSSLPIVLAQSLRHRPEVVLVLAPAFFCAPGAWLAARIAGAKAWIHIQDFELDAAFALGLLSSKGIQVAAEWIEKSILRLFNRVTTISPNMVNRLIEKGVPIKRAGLFPNWVDTSQIIPNDEAGKAFRNELGISQDAQVALYSGNMGEKQGLDILIDAAQKLQRFSNLTFVICGDGAAKARLIERSQDLPNVRFFPLQPFDKLNALLNMADFHLLPQRADAADLVLPSKLTGILASGRTVIATAAEGTSLARLVQEAGGLICPPENVEALADRIVELACDPESCRARGKIARCFAEGNLSKDAILKQAFQADWSISP
jgi:colanic acid biosynthesis glycosyl transferase WcaI